MEITEVRIKLMEKSDDRLRAFCSITFDNAFVVRDLKIIDGLNGPFVAMPSRKLTTHCPRCGCKNHLKAPYCNQCGERQREERLARDADGRAKLYADIAHPINSGCREMIQQRVIAEFQVELERAKQPGYVSRYDDDYGYEDLETAPSAARSEEGPGRPSPAETRIEPPQAAVPHPHVSAPAPASHESGGLSGPHHAPVADDPAKSAKAKPDFGAGILDS